MKYKRQTQFVFGSSAGNRSLTAFGTAKTDSPEYTTDIQAIQNSNYLQGWSSAILADRAPYEEDTNGLLYMITSQLAYLLQSGIPEYDSATEYYMSNTVAAPDGSGNWYKSLTDNNIGNALTDTDNWQLINLNKRTMPLFSQMTLDYVLQGDDAIGYALQGSLVNGNIYQEAFNKILNLYNTGSTVNYRGINSVLTNDGRYITVLNNKNAVDNLFSNTGIADFYILDTSTSSFYLPKTSKFLQYTTDITAVNKYNSAGLPAPNITLSGAGNVTTSSAGRHNHKRGTQNITGAVTGIQGRRSVTGSGAFSTTALSSKTQLEDNSSGSSVFKFSFNAADNWTGESSTNGEHSHMLDLSSLTATGSGGLFGVSNTVQPASSNKLLYYLVGNTAS